MLDAVEVTKKTDLNEIEAFVALKNEIEEQLGDSGRLFVRYSGTQNLCRIMLEGKDLKQITDFKDRVKAVLNNL